MDSNHHDDSNGNVMEKNVSHQRLDKDSEDKRIPSLILSQDVKDKLLIPIFCFRVVFIALWTAGILYSTYHVFLAAETMHFWMRDPVLNPSLFSDVLNRGKDSTDYEWIVFSPLIWTKLLFYFTAYSLLSRMFVYLDLYEFSTWMSLPITFLMQWDLCGFSSALYIYTIPVIYWFLLRVKSKLVIWVATFLFIVSLNTPFLVIIGGTDSKSVYLFAIILAWNFSKCVSFCFDVWDRPEEQRFSLNALGDFMRYIFYLPVSLTGPLVLYEHFESKVLRVDPSQNKDSQKNNLALLFKNLCKLMLITILTELIYHYLYFRPLSLSYAAIKDMNLWAVCGTIYWLGQIFSLKYKVMYGVPSALAEFDGLNMYPLPCCPAYVHRYSALWKDFDRGLYLFLVKYIYIPILGGLRASDPNNRINNEAQKLIASFGTFVYVYIWHNISYDVFVWTSLNFLGITIERIGSLIKIKIDKLQKIDPIIWDFIVEPIFTAPLAAMSILNSSVFCGNLPAANAFAQRLWEHRADNYVLYFMYFMAHAGITFRTWKSFSPALTAKLKLK